MWPKGNIERQPSTDKPLEGFTMSTEISRRDFLKIVFASTSAVAVSGASALWPLDALPRPVAEPVYLEIDGSGYIVDPRFDYCDLDVPTYREYHSLVGFRKDELKGELQDIFDKIEHLVSDPDNWSIDEVEEWLDASMDIADMGTWEGMRYTHYGPAIQIYEQMSRQDAYRLGLELIDGDHPGSDFVGIAFRGDVTKLNKELEQLGMNLVIS
jgi:hypothetical protein